MSTVALEGPGWLLEDLDERLADLGRREELLQALRSIEGEDTLLGVSSHLLSIGQKTKAKPVWQPVLVACNRPLSMRPSIDEWSPHFNLCQLCT